MEQGLLTTVKKDGSVYSYRQNRLNIMSPKEWESFISLIKDRHLPLFETLLQTGARPMEALHLQVKDFDFEKKTLVIKTIKQRTRFSDELAREIKLSTQYCDKIQKFIFQRGFNDDDYLFLDNDKLPSGYEKLPNKEKRKYYEVRQVSYSNILKRNLKKAGIDPSLYSLGNIRKTSGNWLWLLKINHSIILRRLGHNQSTALKHYVADSTGDEQYKYKARLLLGDLYV